MFTGLVEEQGIVKSLVREGTNLHLQISCNLVLEDISLGASIAVDGVCQTVTKFDSESFWVTAIDETLKLTNFGTYQIGTKVNLERCLRASDRLGGHIVQGHVDAVGEIISIIDASGSYEVTVQIPENLSRYVIHKGSICINGISLTVASISGNLIKVCIIPKTWDVTNLSFLQTGSKVNIEVDVLAKYLEKLQKL